MAERSSLKRKTIRSADANTFSFVSVISGECMRFLAWQFSKSGLGLASATSRMVRFQLKFIMCIRLCVCWLLVVYYVCPRFHNSCM